MKTIAEQITALEAKRSADAARMEEVMQKSLDENRSTNEQEQEEFDTLDVEVQAIDKDLKRLRTLEKTMAATARPAKAENEREGVVARAPQSSIVVKTQPKLDPGIRFTRLAKVKMMSRLSGERAIDVAAQMYGSDSEPVAVCKAAVDAGTTLSGSWAADLVSAEGGPFADFASYLRPSTIIGKFGAGGVPALRRVPFRRPLITQTGGGAAYWVGEGKPKPLTSFDFTRTTLEPLKIANICVLTEESIRYSDPASDMIVRDSLREAIVAGQDVAFIDPANGGSSNVKPASITNGAETIGSTGTDADAIRVDVRAVFQKFIDANNPPSAGVWIMSTTNALALSLMVNALSQREFPGMGMMGGTFEGLPAIVSDHIGSVVGLVNASDVFLADDGEIAVDISREASLEMLDSGSSQDAGDGTGASLVSMFQTNSVALRAEHTISWKLRRASAVAYVTGVTWGGAVPTA